MLRSVLPLGAFGYLIVSVGMFLGSRVALDRVTSDKTARDIPVADVMPRCGRVLPKCGPETSGGLRLAMSVLLRPVKRRQWLSRARIPGRRSKHRRRLHPQVWRTPPEEPSESESSWRQAFRLGGISRFAGRSCAAPHGPARRRRSAALARRRERYSSLIRSWLSETQAGR